MAFNITISHAIGSLYDARNLTVTDTAQGMDIYDSGVSTIGGEKHKFLGEYKISDR